jgi:hypothetical protein
MSARSFYNGLGAVVSVAFAVLSLLAVYFKDCLPWALSASTAGKIIVATWAIAPPVFFWIDWVIFCASMPMDSKEREVAKHTHDLSRNIWLGLLGVVTFGFFKLHGLS